MKKVIATLCVTYFNTYHSSQKCAEYPRSENNLQLLVIFTASNTTNE